MNNNQDQKGMYQFPTTLGAEAFDVQVPVENIELSEAELKEQSIAAGRQRVSGAFGQIIRGDEMHDMWHETQPLPQSEVLQSDPIMAGLRRNSTDMRELHRAHQQSLAESERISTTVGKIITRLLSERPFTPPSTTIGGIVGREEAAAHGNIFPKDRDVTDLKFFYLPDGDSDIWYHSQTSPITSKNFTISFTLPKNDTLTSVGYRWKSTTFYDERYSRVVNVSSQVDATEAQDLLAASTKYVKIVEEMYRKKPARRMKFGSKGDYDLAA